MVQYFSIIINQHQSGLSAQKLTSEHADNIKVRLDRGLANPDFIDIFPDRTVWHVQTTDH